MARLIDAIVESNCSKCFYAMEIEQNGVQILGGAADPKLYFCMRNPPQINMVPVHGQVQGNVTLQPMSQFPAVRDVHVCGEFIDEADAEQA